MLELRPEFGLAMETAFIRVEGRALDMIANNSNSPTGGAIDSDGRIGDEAVSKEEIERPQRGHHTSVGTRNARRHVWHG